MTLWTGLELNQIFSSSVPDDLAIKGISIDTRTINPGDLFIALKGDQGDGHTFLDKAEKAGAGAALVSTFYPQLSIPQILVDDTLQGLCQLARVARSRTKARVIAITGSVGKTSTKDILAQVLTHFGPVSYSHASYNNHWGVPLSLARIDRDAAYAILEVGMNNPGEILPLAKLIQPEIAVITVIAPAHIGHMGSIEAIAHEKAQLFDGLVAGGIAIMPHDTPFKDLLVTHARQCQAANIFTVGMEEGADIKGAGYKTSLTHQGSSLTVHTQGHEISCTLELVGEHLALIALTTYAVAQGLSLDLNRVTNYLRHVHPVKGRGQHHQLLINGMPIYLVDDAYNANLTSMIAGLKVLTTLTPHAQGRRIAILGEMLELGEYAMDHHGAVATFIAQVPIDQVFVTGGEAMEYCFNLLPDHQRGSFKENAQDLIPILLSSLRPHDVLYIKGSKGSRVSLVVDALLNQSHPSVLENIA